MKKLIKNRFGKNSTEYDYFMYNRVMIPHEQLEELFRMLYIPTVARG